MSHTKRESCLVIARVIVLLAGVIPPAGMAANFSSKDYPVGGAPGAVAVGDFNGDGKPDLAVANGKTGDVSILLNRGDGSFSAATSLTVGASPHSIAVGDFNGDHKLDVVIGSVDVLGSQTAVRASLLLGNGDGTFQPAVQLNVNAALVIAGDINRDGKLDLITDGGVLLGNGDGTFQAPSNIGAKSPAVLGDFNGDGKLDLVADDSLLLGNGDGTFQPPMPFRPGGYTGNYAAADFNGDGKLDLAFEEVSRSHCFDECSPPSYAVSVVLGNGDGTFRFGTQAAVIGSNGRGAEISFFTGDFNGDGKLDLAASHGDVQGFTVSLGKGDGTFPSQISFDTGSGPVSLATADLNNDHLLDVILVNGNDNTISVALNHSPTTGADLAVQVSALPEPVSVTQTLRYSVRLQNQGPQDASSLTLTDTLPSSVTLESATITQGTCAQSNQLVTCSIDKLVSGDSALAIIVSTPTATGTITDSVKASATESDGNPANNSASHSTRVDPMFTLTIKKTGAGTGLVASTPFADAAGAISCGKVCTASLPTGTVLNLQVSPDSGSGFGGWGGACSTPAPGCDLTMNSDQTVTAEFDQLPNFALWLGFSSLTVQRGKTDTESVGVVPEGSSFNGAIKLSCTVQGAAPLPGCTLSPSTVTLPNSNGATSTLTIATTTPTAAQASASRSGWLYAIWLPMFGVMLLAVDRNTQRKKHSRVLGLVFAVLLLTGTMFQAGCGGGSSTGDPPHGSGGTPLGNYSITITATSGATQHSTTLTLTVQ